MSPRILEAVATTVALTASVQAKAFDRDVIQTAAGPLELTFVGHGSLVLTFGGKVFHVDPFGKVADYSKLPKADVILVTHAHGDHLDAQALAAVRTSDTQVFVGPACRGKVEGAKVLEQGESVRIAGVGVLAIPAYNLVHRRPDGTLFHPPGDGIGLLLTFGDKRVLVAGDTENTPELKAVRNIDVAFLPMNLPYTMTPEMVADAARAIRPRILYPYHYGETDPSRLVSLLAGEDGLEVRVRSLR